jgi:outer membrane protein assembly factor BamB
MTAMKKGYCRMKKGGLTTNRIYLIVAVAVLILGVGAVFGHIYYNGKTTGIENSSITTGAQNSCLAYDDYSRTLIVGTHDNSIIAFRDDQEIWRVQATGAFSEIEINHALDTVFAGNENNHIYEYSLEDGQLLNDIDAQRRIVALDVSNDGSKIAIATITGTSKANALVYADDGTELMNVPYKDRRNRIY